MIVDAIKQLCEEKKIDYAVQGAVGKWAIVIENPHIQETYCIIVDEPKCLCIFATGSNQHCLVRDAAFDMSGPKSIDEIEKIIDHKTDPYCEFRRVSR